MARSGSARFGRSPTPEPPTTELAPEEVGRLTADIVSAFGLKDDAGRKLTVPATLNGATARRLVDELGRALDAVRPVTQAPSIGEILRALAAIDTTTPTRARRRLVAELVALVAQASHRRAKRQERKRILGELVVLFDLERAIGVSSSSTTAALSARLAAVSLAIATILDA